eukprot:m.12851 g.12851  ORF g.12851 m.12851 type:complete len:225 (+) comp4372_c0_seq1:194-868(+)
MSVVSLQRVCARLSWHFVPGLIEVTLPGLRRLRFASRDAQAGPSVAIAERDAVAMASSETAAAAAPGALVGAQGVPSKPTRDEVVVQHVVIRRDLLQLPGWTIGSVVSQACHATLAAVVTNQQDGDVQNYLADLDSMHTVALEIKSEQALRALASKLSQAGVPHYLWVEQPENFASCLATKPMQRGNIPKALRKLKLFKGISLDRVGQPEQNPPSEQVQPAPPK